MANFLQLQGAANGTNPLLLVGADTDTARGLNVQVVGASPSPTLQFPGVAVLQYLGGSTSTSIRNNANTADNLLITNSGTNTVRASLVTGLVTLTNATTITPDASLGNWQTVSNGVASQAIAFANPINPPAASSTEVLTLEVYNSSAGAIGAITFGTAYVLLGGALTLPAAGKHRFIQFQWNGVSWIEIVRAAVDY